MEIKAPEKSNQVFSDYVTSTAFHLHLSRNMVGFLAHVYKQHELCGGSIKYEDQPDFEHYRNARGFHDHATPGSALLRRGLIYSPIPEWPGIFHPTEAGKKVFELLEIAGLVND